MNKTEKSAWVDQKFTKISRVAEKLLGIAGRMLYTSKSMKKPTTIFNANIFNAKAKKIWFGDLEIERDREALLRLSQKLGTIYILYEMDGRFLKTMPTPEYVKYMAVVTIEGGNISYSKDFARRVKILTERIKEKEKWS
jgi:hypothetical protein